MVTVMAISKPKEWLQSTLVQNFNLNFTTSNTNIPHTTPMEPSPTPPW